ncbi:MAG: AI-2E family transporter [Pseudanabaenaceae cyanobacterium]
MQIKQEWLWRWLKRLLMVGTGLYLAWRLQQTLLILGISLFLAGAIAPFVEWLEKYNIKRAWAVGILYILLLIVLILTIAPMPRLLNELGQFFINLPQLINQIPLPDTPFLGLTPEQVREIIQPSVIINQVIAIGRELATQTPEIIFRFLNALGIGLLSLLITAYLVVNGETMLRRALSPFSETVRQEIYTLIPPITRCLSAYVLGRMGTSALLGFCTYLVLELFSVPFSGALGLLMAVVNLIPFVGGMLGLITIVLAAWHLGTVKVIIVFGSVLILQQIEAWILQPWLVAPYLNLDPFELLMSVIIGIELVGVVGAVIAPPVAGIARIIFAHFWLSAGKQE